MYVGRYVYEVHTYFHKIAYLEWELFFSWNQSTYTRTVTRWSPWNDFSSKLAGFLEKSKKKKKGKEWVLMRLRGKFLR